MKGVSCTQGGHNGEQLENMCLLISEDVHQSLMSKHNSNNSATADCAVANREDGLLFLDPAEECEPLGLVGAGRDAPGHFLL